MAVGEVHRGDAALGGEASTSRMDNLRRLARHVGAIAAVKEFVLVAKLTDGTIYNKLFELK